MITQLCIVKFTNLEAFSVGGDRIVAEVHLLQSRKVLLAVRQITQTLILYTEAYFMIHVLYDIKSVYHDNKSAHQS